MKPVTALLLLFLLSACARRAQPFDFPRPVDTATKPIVLQEKKTYAFPGGLRFDNEFPAARLSNVLRFNDSVYVAKIEAENVPINSSPWYAFRLRAATDRNVTVRLAYPADYGHRYDPKVSEDRKTWRRVPDRDLTYNADSTGVDVRLRLTAGRELYLAGQEVISAAEVKEWARGIAARRPDFVLESAGESRLGRDLPVLHLAAGELDRRPTIVLMSRQHPPEVSGYLCFQAFVTGLVEHPRAAEFLGRYQLLVFPVINPDGVDLGHWRHTAGGIDSNRDWAFYRQPEPRQVADYVVKTVGKARSEVVLGMDFHSTQEDVYYTHSDEVLPPTALPGFKDAWLRAVEAKIGGGFRVNEEAEPIGRPTTMSWFRTQFGAEGITYEIGDETDRAFVARKGRESAAALIEVLLAR